jgi:hypothetical protein
MRKAIIVVAALIASTSAVWATADCEGPGPCGSDAEVIDNELSHIQGHWATETLWCKEGNAPLYMNSLIIKDRTIQTGSMKCVINEYTINSDDEDTMRLDIKATCRNFFKSYTQKLNGKLDYNDYGISIAMFGDKYDADIVGTSRYPIKCDR